MTTPAQREEALPEKGEVFARGLRLRCPRCGQGRLLAGYLAPQDACGHCGESFESLRADDGPAWLTVLVVGHIVVPLMLALIQHDILVDPAIQMGVAVGLCLLGVAVMLPRAKGVFMALIWLFNQDTGKPRRPDTG